MELEIDKELLVRQLQTVNHSIDELLNTLSNSTPIRVFEAVRHTTDCWDKLVRILLEASKNAS